MSAAALKSLGIATGWIAERWQTKFAEHLARQIGALPAAHVVYGIFGAAVLRDGLSILGEDPFAKILHLTDKAKRARSKAYLPALSQSCGYPVHLVERPALGQGIEDIEFARETRARVDRLKIKTSNKGVML